MAGRCYCTCHDLNCRTLAVIYLNGGHIHHVDYPCPLGPTDEAAAPREAPLALVAACGFVATGTPKVHEFRVSDSAPIFTRCADPLTHAPDCECATLHG